MKRSSSSGFTLVELLVVIAIGLIMTSLAISAFNPESTANNFTSAIGTVATMSEEARAYAMSKNTYAYLCFLETNALGTDLTTPGTGRVVLQIFGTTDGMAANGIVVGSTGSNLSPLTKPVFLNNIHIPASPLFNIGNLTRPPLPNVLPTPRIYYVFGDNFIAYPTGNSPFVSGSGSSTYFFPDVVGFTPEGIIQLPTATANSSIPYVEIDLEPTHGNTAPSTQPANCAAVQIDGLTGAVVRYRP